MPPDVIADARQWARQMIADYAAGRCNASLAVSSHGAENNIELQTQAKLAEVAFAIWVGENPTDAVHWGRRPDRGFDIAVGKYRVDVKHTNQHGQYLIWPVKKRHIFASKPFDALVLVKGAGAVYYVWRWIPKDEFFQKKQEAGPGHRLTEGTWFVHQNDCRTMDTFPCRQSEAA